MVIIDKSRVHRLEVRCCDCPNATSPDIQMPKTVFTFRVLDDFLLDNLECWDLGLRRMTSSMFPHLVPDRYRELMRLKTMKWHSFDHRSNNPNAGDLTLFCPACPQPGINISLSGDESLDDHLSNDQNSKLEIHPVIVMDGNFKAEHLHPIKPSDEVWLSDGLGFMVGKDRYKKHLAEAADTVNAARHKLKSMGIGGVACAQHGCFVPHSMVDFQKGERQAKHAIRCSRVNHASSADK
ncbi:hypothetical protein EDB19DRAFT_1900345 [Suillus lakei]|nr:hypothetical protein EDB19DRAFT_1900345 [Suillus lakei]